MGKIAINIFYNKEIRELNAKQMFLFPQVCKVPKEGHFYAQVKALLCPREAQWCTSKTPPVNPNTDFYLSEIRVANKSFCNSYQSWFVNHI